MKRIRTRALAVAVAPLLVGAGVAAAPATAAPAPSKAQTAATAGKDHSQGKNRTVRDIGERPAIFQVAGQTLRNTNFRTAAWTADDLQLTLMNIPVGGDVGLEMHDDIDQFLRIESGHAKVMMGSAKKLDHVKRAGPGDVILVPSGTWHNIVNTSKNRPLKLYSLYGPAEHARGTVHRTQADDPHSGEEKPNPRIGRVTRAQPFTKDPGAVPLVFNITKASRANTNFRTAAWTADDLQLTLMDIPVDGDVGLEMHDDVDQFLRVESGKAKVYFGDKQRNVRFAGVAHAGSAILVPSGTWHNIVNDRSDKPLKLYSLYGPAQHPKGTIHVTQEDDDH